MDDELQLLQAQFFAAQEQKSNVVLAERNVVELVMKLQQLGLFQQELLHTVNGKEYITESRLREEIKVEIKKIGRVPLVELAATLGVDLFYIEREAHRIVANDPETALLQGELLTSTYWNSVAQEVEELLHESGQVSMSELGKRFNLGSELLTSALVERIGTIIHGKLEGGQLYTPAYIARIKSILTGSLRAITVATPSTSIWESCQKLLAETGVLQGTRTESLIATVFQECISDSGVQGSSKGGGSTWIPSVFASCQRESVDSFYSQNGCVTHSEVLKMGITQPKQFLAEKFPDSIPLTSAVVHSSVLDQLEAGLEETVTAGEWCDVLSLLPQSLSAADASLLMAKSQILQRMTREGSALLIADAFLCSAAFLKVVSWLQMHGIFCHWWSNLVFYFSPAIDAEQTLTQRIEKEAKLKGAILGQQKSAKVKPAAVKETQSETNEERPVKGGKGGKGRRKGGKNQAVTITETEVSGFAMTETEVADKIQEWFPEMEGQGNEECSLAQALSHQIRPALVESFLAAKKAEFSQGAEKRKKRREALQTYLVEAFSTLQLLAKGLEVFKDDSGTQALLQRHILRTAGTECADSLILTLVQEEEGTEQEETLGTSSALPPAALTAGERLALAKSLPAGTKALATRLAERVEGKSIPDLLDDVESMAEELGIRLRRMDKKSERSSLHAYKMKIVRQFEAEEDPVIALGEAIVLLFIKAHNRAVNAPGRSLQAVFLSTKELLPKDTFDFVSGYLETVVKYISVTGSDGDLKETLNLELCGKLENLRACVLSKDKKNDVVD